MFSDLGLTPASVYTYAVTSVNKAGSRRSEFVPVATLDDRPVHVLPPSALVKPKQLHAIFLSWSEPKVPNGKHQSFLTSHVYYVSVYI